MSFLILNLGSTSFKFELFDSGSLESQQEGQFEIDPHSSGVNQEAIDKLFREALRQIGDVSQIKAVGHRVVHGGDHFLETTEVTSEVLPDLEILNQLAPLHNPYNLAGIKASNKYLPDTKDYAVFDTAFFKDLPEVARVYPIPYKYYESGIKKFGFHGISHKFAAQDAAAKIKKPLDKINVITLHLGGGASVCAIAKGKPIDTSMGFTPLEGLMMQTRSGDIGEGVVIQIFNELLLTESDSPQAALEQLKNILNYESGIKGICGKDNFLELLKATSYGDAQAKLAFDMFVHRAKKYLGAYAALLGEVDVIAFTGAVGAGKPQTRKKILDKISWLKKVPVVVVPPHEELAIAQEIQIELKLK